MWVNQKNLHFFLDGLAEAIGSGRLAARKAARSPSRRAALQTILAFGVAGTAYGLYRGTRIGEADKVAFSELGLDKLPMNDLMLQRASLHDALPVELIEYADIDLNLQVSDLSLQYVDKETGEDLDAMLSALLDVQQEQEIAAPIPPILFGDEATGSAPLAPLPDMRAALDIPAHRSVPDLVLPQDRSEVAGSEPSRSSVPGQSQTVRIADANAKTITIQSTHTGERLRAKFVSNGLYDEGALAELNHLLRDHRNGKVRDIDRALFDTAHEIAMRTRGHDRAILHLVSGYRSPETNIMLRSKSGGVAKNSYHVRGRAMDMFVDGAPIKDVHVAALRSSDGGVGYYPSSNFIHIDTGPERSWPSRYKPLATKYRA
ncbi:MAG: DUF882 domain-containing protein [Alphaproteobacteria bacterium TMED89]|nr:hypothetical protein [Rhodospirillaceae bacterium]RPH09971.1 MAG: DUF882 domain-containing protein [Alphaproteobacteria bacterium TMED89]